MDGPTILARFLSTAAEPDKFGHRWQYNSRSDRHSKIGSWGVAFDLLMTSSLLRKHVRDGKVVLGVNHTMRDFQTGREKALDLVLARPVGPVNPVLTFKGLGTQIPLSAAETDSLANLPDVPVAPVGAVLVALEAKAAMTAHQKALPRLYDELNSSHLCVHGASNQAIAIAYVQVNAATTFASSVTNARIGVGQPLIMTAHAQPRAANLVIGKIDELPRRTSATGVGFDGVGVSVFDLRNDGSPVIVLDRPPAPAAGSAFHYESMIVRMANEYDSRFVSI